MGEIRTVKTNDDIITVIQEDEPMMKMLRVAATLNLPDWWICAGFVRSKIWDTLHGFTERTVIPDVDVIFFDKLNTDEAYEKYLEQKLHSLLPNIPWSVKNEARMHLVNNIAPYRSSEDAISKFPETATALGVKLDEEGNVVLTAPCGIDDVIHLEVKPTPYFLQCSERLALYENRVINKNWKAIWPKLTVSHTN